VASHDIKTIFKASGGKITAKQINFKKVEPAKENDLTDSECAVRTVYNSRPLLFQPAVLPPPFYG
jgi:hypothetical protein